MTAETLSTPIIDDALGLELANNKPEVAEELLTKFMEHLPASHEKINQAFKENDFKALGDEVHRLHGACCYCGVPRLKEIVDTFESALKQKKQHMAEKLMVLLNEAIEDVQEAYLVKEVA